MVTVAMSAGRRQLLVTASATCRCRVVCARNGAEAIQIFESGQEFELLFSDVVMPNGMNGVELAREARRLNKGIKVLLTSGYAGDVLERHRAVDEFPIIDKPFRLADLARRLRSILHEAQDPHVPSLPRRSRTN